MKTLKKYTIIGIIFVVIVGSLSHFVYDWSGKNFIVGLFTPVNESTWEHMKLFFFPMLLYTIYMGWRLKKEFPCVVSGLLGSVLLGTALIPVLFYTYTGILGRDIPALDIASFILSVIAAFAFARRMTDTCALSKWEFQLAVLVVFVAVCFVVFTYYPPGIGLFVSPVIFIPKG